MSKADSIIRPFFDSDGDNTAQVMKLSPGRIYKITVWNTNTADAFLQLFDAAAADVTVGTTTPTYVLPVPSGASATQGAGSIDDYLPNGLTFDRAITYACTTTPTGNTDPTTGLTISAAIDI